MNKNERWVSMEEICEHLGASRDTVKKMVKTQTMPAYKYIRNVMVTEEELIKTTTLKIKRHEEMKKILKGN